MHQWQPARFGLARRRWVLTGSGGATCGCCRSQPKRRAHLTSVFDRTRTFPQDGGRQRTEVRDGAQEERGEEGVFVRASLLVCASCALWLVQYLITWCHRFTGKCGQGLPAGRQRQGNGHQMRGVHAAVHVYVVGSQAKGTLGEQASQGDIPALLPQFWPVNAFATKLYNSSAVPLDPRPCPSRTLAASASRGD